MARLRLYRYWPGDLAPDEAVPKRQWLTENNDLHWMASRLIGPYVYVLRWLK